MEAKSVTLIIFTVYFLALVSYCYVKRRSINVVRALYWNFMVMYGLMFAALHFLPINLPQDKDFFYVPFRKFSDPQTAAFAGRFWMSAVLTALVYVPLGFFTGLVCRLKSFRHPVCAALMAGLLMTLLTEVIQLYLPFNRICDVDEMLFALIGTLAGVWTFCAVRYRPFMKFVVRQILYY